MHQCLDNLEAWPKDPMTMLTTSKDVFNIPLVSCDSAIVSLTTVPDCTQEYELVQTILYTLLCGAIDVLQKQLSRYLTGDLDIFH